MRRACRFEHVDQPVRSPGGAFAQISVIGQGEELREQCLSSLRAVIDGLGRKRAQIELIELSRIGYHIAQFSLTNAGHLKNLKHFG